MMIQIGKNLKKLRLNCGFTEKDIAKKLGVAVSTISAYENNSRKPSCENLIKLAKLYGVSIDYLLYCNNNNSLNVDGLDETQILVVNSLIQCLKRNNSERKKKK